MCFTFESRVAGVFFARTGIYRVSSFVVSLALALNKVNIVAITTILVLHVGNGRSEHVWLDITFLAIRASCSLAVRAMRSCAQGWSRGPCHQRQGSGGHSPPPGKQEGLGGAGPPILYLATPKINILLKLLLSRVVVLRGITKGLRVIYMGAHSRTFFPPNPFLISYCKFNAFLNSLAMGLLFVVFGCRTCTIAIPVRAKKAPVALDSKVKHMFEKWQYNFKKFPLQRSQK